MLFEVFNTRTSEVKFETDDLVAADILVDRENFKEVGVGYEPCWIVRGRIESRIFHITVEEQ